MRKNRWNEWNDIKKGRVSLYFDSMVWKKVERNILLLNARRASFWNDYFGRSEEKLLLSKNNKKCLWM